MEVVAAIMSSISQGLTAVGSMINSQNIRGTAETNAISANLSANAASDRSRILVSSGIIAIVIIAMIFIALKRGK